MSLIPPQLLEAVSSCLPRAYIGQTLQLYAPLHIFPDHGPPRTFVPDWGSPHTPDQQQHESFAPDLPSQKPCVCVWEINELRFNNLLDDAEVSESLP